VRNHFAHRDAAQRYAAARPYFHPLVVARIAASTGSTRFAHALDVGCGTGQSGNQGLVRISADRRRAETIATGFRNPDGRHGRPLGTAGRAVAALLVRDPGQVRSTAGGLLWWHYGRHL
jgi:hypothetical protein